VLAGGTFPGPVIKGYKGDIFQINVVNLLEDDTMLKTTSVVSTSTIARQDHGLPFVLMVIPTALAWNISTEFELGRRVVICHAMSHHTGELVFVRFSCTTSSGNVLVPFA